MSNCNQCVLGTREELAFWLRIMKEHALFMRNGFERAKVELYTEAEEFRKAYLSLQERLESGASSEYIVHEAKELTHKFLKFKLNVLELLVTCKTGRDGGSLYPLLVDHIAREARQFLEILEWCGMAEDDSLTKPVLLVSKEVFWIRQMADHAKFIRSLLDPSERKLVIAAQTWSDTFDRLYLQAKDLDSMLKASVCGFPAVERFTSEVVEETRGLRDFKQSAEKLLEKCQVLSIISPLLADHVAREAEYFLKVIHAINEPTSHDKTHSHSHTRTHKRRRTTCLCSLRG